MEIPNIIYYSYKTALKEMKYTVYDVNTEFVTGLITMIFLIS
ncbi:hypothetical protein RINTHH_21730 [Richelia intracellularis HH01]|jgi:hypothetical protein|uniref:Uncharacterized protein n=1 Tax=Richelia intracellularis HH01 TaxID=1165094 RepID=M1X1M3_9NOST|nr:hypothetical protein RINTHH_21730 [Richelia intracellularis HH01]